MQCQVLGRGKLGTEMQEERAVSLQHVQSTDMMKIGVALTSEQVSRKTVVTFKMMHFSLTCAM